MSLAACGQVRLLDPDQALKDQLQLVSATRFVIEADPNVYLLVRIGSREAIDRVRLSLSGASGAFEIPTVSLAARQLCGDGATCLAISLPPGLPMDLDRVRLSVPDIGHSDATDLTVVSLDRTDVTGTAQNGNQTIDVTIDDPIRRALPPEVTTVDDLERSVVLFERRFDAIARPGACGDPPAAGDPNWAAVGGARFALDVVYPQVDAPIVCVSVRPATPTGGPAVAQRGVEARAVVTTFEHVYRAPIETAPLVFMPFFDLELPNEARCTAAEGLIASAIADAAQTIASETSSQVATLMLDSVRIANRDGLACRQANDRGFDPTVVRRNVQAVLDARFGADARVRVLFVYATNLDLEPPLRLIEDFSNLRRSFTEEGSDNLRAALVTIAADRAAASLEPDLHLPFGATEEPSFRASIVDTLRGLWPFRTSLHGASTVVPLVDEAQRGRFVLYKVCDGSHPVNPLGTPLGGVVEVPPQGPAYRVNLVPRLLLPPDAFTPPTVTIRWQGCEALCDRPAPAANRAWFLDGSC